MPSTNSDQHTFGNVFPFRVPGKKYKVQRNGLATYDVQYRGIIQEGQQIDFKQGDAPEDGEYPNQVLLEISITGDNTVCGGVVIDLHYEGKAEDEFTKTDTTDDLSIEYVGSQEDIYAHPDFRKFAGAPGVEKHGAKFDPATGKFSFFDQADTSLGPTLPNPYTGITSYILPTPVISLTRIETSWPTQGEFTSIGKIATPSDYTNNAPNLPAGESGKQRNWLYVGLRIRNIANTYFETVRKFQGSGPRPINIGIYGNPPDFT